MKNWYRFENAVADPSVADIHIIDMIGGWMEDVYKRNGWGDFAITAKQFVDDLAALPEAVRSLRVHINSPGGDVFAAVHIANALREQQQSKGRVVETYIDGLAASAASVIAMAGSKVVMADNALLMIHNPWTFEIGDASVMRKTADVLDTIRGQIVATYQWQTDLAADEITALMDAETWMTADEAIERGFATDKVDGLRAAASITPEAMASLKVPEQFKARVASFTQQPDPAQPAPVAASAADVLAACEAADCLDIARDLINSQATADQVATRVATVKASRDAARARETEIRSICAVAKQPELADGYVRGGMSATDVRAHLTVITAKLDAVDIDGGLHPSAGVTDVGHSWKQAFARANRRGLAH